MQPDGLRPTRDGRHFRDRTWSVHVHRALQERTAEVEHCVRELTQELGRALPERERRILRLRSFGNMIQSQIADRMGISQMHISRLLGRTLARLREEIIRSNLA